MQFFTSIISNRLAALMMTENATQHFEKNGADKTVFAETEQFSYIIDVTN